MFFDNWYYDIDDKGHLTLWLFLEGITIMIA